MKSDVRSSPTELPSEEIRPSCVLGFAAPIEAGKTTLSSELADRLNAPRVSFGDYLRELAAERRIPVTREALQDLGEELVLADARDFCRTVLRQQPWQSDRPLIVDGVRHQEIFELLRELVTPTVGYLIYVKIDRTTQDRRLRQDDLPHEKSLDELERHSTEAQVRAVLPDTADLILDGSHPPEELVERILEFLKSPYFGNEPKSWEEKNIRRIALAKKKNREGLTQAELAEFDQLQTGYFEYLDAKWSGELPDSTRLDEIEARLKESDQSQEGQQ